MMLQPFERFRPEYISRLIKLNKGFLVSQSYYRAFNQFEETHTMDILVTDYDDSGLAKTHLNAIKGDKLAELIDLKTEKDRDRLLAMLQPGLGYSVYWAIVSSAAALKKKVDIKYADNVRRFILSNTDWRVSAEETIRPSLKVIFGEMYMIIKRGSQHEIPLNGVYEHRSVAPYKNKIPYFIKPRDQKIFYLPGLYSVTELPDIETGEVIKRWSYTLITRPANDLMKVIHNDGDNRWRMPLFLPNELSQRWLFNELDPEEYKLILDFEMPSDELEAWTVFTVRSTKPRPDGLAKNQPFVWEGIPIKPEIAA